MHFQSDLAHSAVLRYTAPRSTPFCTVTMNHGRKPTDCPPDIHALSPSWPSSPPQTPPTSSDTPLLTRGSRCSKTGRISSAVGGSSSHRRIYSCLVKTLASVSVHPPRETRVYSPRGSQAGSAVDFGRKRGWCYGRLGWRL